MFEFAYPYSFLLLIPLAFAAFRVYQRRINRAIYFSPLFRINHPRSFRLFFSMILPSLLIAGVFLCIVSLARPRTLLSSVRRSTNAIAIYMVIDISGSMEALDLSEKTPTGIKFRTRLDVVKDTFSDFIKKRKDDLIGIVSFGGYASTRAPLTTDHEALLHLMKDIQIIKQNTGNDGTIANKEEFLTAIGDGLATACARLEPSEVKSKIIVLLTDGESNTGVIKPMEAAETARKLGIRVYTIGVGSNGRAPFKVKDYFGREVIQWAEVSIDEDLLRSIAKTTGGQYFNVRDPKGLERALYEIDKLEKTEVNRMEFQLFDEWFMFFLIPGLTLIFFAATANVILAKRVV